jgi:hypothetical protein
MTELQRPQDVDEITQETFLGLMDEYYSVIDRKKQIKGRLAAHEDGRKRLPEMTAFASWNEYLKVKWAYDQFDELAAPVIGRLKEELEAIENRKVDLQDRLLLVLPHDVWFRYGDRAVCHRRVQPQRHYPFGSFDDGAPYSELQFWAWSAVAPIRPAVTRQEEPLSPWQIVAIPTVAAFIMFAMFSAVWLTKV